MENKNKNPKYSFQEMGVSLNTITRQLRETPLRITDFNKC